MKTIKQIVFILCMAMIAAVLSACDMFNEPVKDESSAVLSNDEISKVQPDDSTVDTSARMTLQEVKDIIEQNDTFEDIMAALEQRQPVADNYSYTDRATYVYYWMDDEGAQKVVITYEPGKIEHIVYTETLFDKTKPELSKVGTKASSGHMTLQEVKDIVRQNDTFAEIMAALEKRQPVADDYYGSGVTLIDYYMDDEGRQKVNIIYEQGQIYYDELLFGNAE